MLDDVVGHLLVVPSLVLQDGGVSQAANDQGQRKATAVEFHHLPKGSATADGDRVLVGGGHDAGAGHQVVHRAKEIEREGGHPVKEELEQHAVPDHDEDQVAGAAPFLSVLGEEELVVDKVHAQKRYQERDVPEHIVDEEVQNDDAGGRENDQALDIIAVQDTRDGRRDEDDQVCTPRRVRAQVGGQKDFVVAGNVARQEGPEEWGEDAVPAEHVGE